MSEQINKLKIETTVKVVKRGARKPDNPLLHAFRNAKSAAAEIARFIANDSSFNVPADVSRFLDEFGR